MRRLMPRAGTKRGTVTDLWTGRFAVNVMGPVTPRNAGRDRPSARR